MQMPEASETKTLLKTVSVSLGGASLQFWLLFRHHCSLSNENPSVSSLFRLRVDQRINGATTKYTLWVNK